MIIHKKMNAVPIIESEIENELARLELNIQNCVSLVERIEGRLYLILAEPKPRANEKCNDELVKSKLGGRLKVFFLST